METSAKMSFPMLDEESVGALLPIAGSSPERRLLVAMLERAILDFVGNDRREIEEASDWLFGEYDEPHPSFSFPWVCSELDLNLEKVRRDISAMPKRGTQRVAPWYFSNQKTSIQQRHNHNERAKLAVRLEPQSSGRLAKAS